MSDKRNFLKRFAQFVLAGLQRKPMYEGTKRVTNRAERRRIKHKRQMVKASRRANRGNR